MVVAAAAVTKSIWPIQQNHTQQAKALQVRLLLQHITQPDSIMQHDAT
jgi:hypothetical protein